MRYGYGNMPGRSWMTKLGSSSWDCGDFCSSVGWGGDFVGSKPSAIAKLGPPPVDARELFVLKNVVGKLINDYWVSL